MKLAASLTWFFRAARLCLAAAMALAALPGRADDAKHARMENRFLFVIETSSSMKSRTNGVQEAVAGLLKSGLQGELRKGDTLGLWSYGEKLHPEFPMLLWSEENKGAIAEMAQRYLRQLRYERWGHLDKVWPTLRQALAKSERLTVIFIYDGEETLRGTPFDKDINGLQKQYRREFRAGHLPFVTILAARDGEVFDYTINYPNSIAVPHTADPLPPPETNTPPALAAATPVEPKPPHRIEIVMKGPAAVAPAPAPLAAPPVAPAPPATLANQVVAEAPSAPVPAKPSEPAPQPAATPPPAAPNAVQITNIAATPPPSAAPPVPVSLPPPVAPVASVPAPNAPVSQPRAPAPQPGPMPVAIASTGLQVALFVIAISLLIIAVVLVIFLLRRTRAQPHSSLISQSIDRPR